MAKKSLFLKEEDLKANRDAIVQKSRQIIYGYNLAWTQEWAFKKLKNNKSFVEELVFDNISLWYFIEHFLHRWYKPWMKEHPISEMLLCIDSINRVLDKKKPSRVEIENNKTDFNQLVLKVCRQRGVKVTNLRLKEKKKSFKWAMNNHFLIKNYLRLRISLRKLVGMFCKKTPRKRILVLTNTGLSNKENKTDFFWGPLIKEFDKQRLSYKVVEYDVLFDPNQDFIKKQFFERYFPRQKYDAEFIGRYYNSKTRKNSREVVGFLRRKFKGLDKRKDFRESLSYKGINFYGLMRKRLEKIFKVYSIYLGDTYALGKAIIEKEKPELVLIDHEKNYYGMSMLLEAKKRKIYTVSMEGELVYSTNTKMIQIPIREVNNRKSSIWRPIADKKLLTGEFSREWHEKRYYIPSKNLEVIGSPKYDFLRKMTPRNRQNIFKKYGIKDKEKLVLVITGKLPFEEEYLRSVKSALKGLGLKNIFLIIKQHPRFPSDKELIKGIMNKTRGKAVQNENTSHLIYSADLVVTINSTIINECILLDKKTVLFEPTSDVFSWMEEGLVKACETPAQLEREIRSAFAKKSALNPEIRKKYIKRYFYCDDGRASERAANEIRVYLRSLNN